MKKKLDLRSEKSFFRNLCLASALALMMSILVLLLGGLSSTVEDSLPKASMVLILMIGVISLVIFVISFSRFKRLSHVNLENSEYQTLLNNSLDLIIMCDVEGIITEVNNAAVDILGYENSELVGTHIKTLYANEEEYLKVFNSLGKDKKFQGNVENLTKSGDIISCSLTASFVKNDAGEIIGTMGISKDITEDSIIREQYENIVSNASDIIYASDFNGVFTFLNPTFEKLTGYETKEFIGRSFLDVIDPEYKNKVQEHYRKHFQKKLKESYFEFKLVKKTGEKFWVGQNVITKFKKGDPEKIVGFFGIVRDIDEVKQIELALSHSEEKYRTLVDNSSDLIHVIDSEGFFLFTNDAWHEHMGYSSEEIGSLNLFNLIHPESKEHCENLFGEIISTGACPQGKVRYSLLTKHGKEIIVEGSVNTEMVNGELVSIQTFLRDVTEVVRNQELLAKQERTLRQITETLDDVFYLYNIQDSKYEYISPNCEEILGANQEFFYSGKSHKKEFCHPEDLEILVAANETVNEGESYEIQFRILLDGEERWINEKSIAIQNDSGEVEFNSGICRDITEIKLAQDIISHQNKEINSSLEYAKLIQNSVLPSESEMKNIAANSMVLYHPKDVLSGDFYMMDEITTNNGAKYPVFVVADCTGHGVPGGVLSLLCNGLLRESFTNHMINSPAAALDYVRIKLMRLFRSGNDVQINDGMDLIFCLFDKEKMKLNFASANRPCIIIRNKEIIEHKGDRQHVGYSKKPEPFTNQSVDVQKDDLIILTSDGYADQFGGPRQRKFMRQRLYDILLENSNVPLEELKNILDQKFKEWKADGEQTDDVTLMAIRIE